MKEMLLGVDPGSGQEARVARGRGFESVSRGHENGSTAVMEVSARMVVPGYMGPSRGILVPARIVSGYGNPKVTLEIGNDRERDGVSCGRGAPVVGVGARPGKLLALELPVWKLAQASSGATLSARAVLGYYSPRITLEFEDLLWAVGLAPLAAG